MVVRLALAPCTARFTLAIGNAPGQGVRSGLGKHGRTGSSARRAGSRSDAEHPSHAAAVAGGHDALAAEAALLGGRLLLEDVVQLGVPAHQLAVLGDGEVARGTLVGLHLGHGVSWWIRGGRRRLGRAHRRGAPRGRLAGGRTGGPGGRLAAAVLLLPALAGCGAVALVGAARGGDGALARREHRDHVPPVLAGRAVHLGELADVGGQPLQQAPPELGVGHLAAPEHDGDLDLVALAQEAFDVALLGGVVVLVDLGPHLHFLEDDQALLAPALLGLDGLLVLVLRVVHQLADRRPRHRRDLDQVEVELVGHPQGGDGVHDAELLPVGTHHPDLGGPDPVVDPWLYADALSLLTVVVTGNQESGPKRAAHHRSRWPALTPGLDSPGGEKPLLLL